MRARTLNHAGAVDHCLARAQFTEDAVAVDEGLARAVGAVGRWRQSRVADHRAFVVERQCVALVAAEDVDPRHHGAIIENGTRGFAREVPGGAGDLALVVDREGLHARDDQAEVDDAALAPDPGFAFARIADDLTCVVDVLPDEAGGQEGCLVSGERERGCRAG